MNKNDSDKVPAWLSAPLSLLSWLLVAFFSAFSFFLGLITMAPLSLIFTLKTRYLIHQVAVFWAKSIILTSPVWKLKVVGRENIDPKKRYVIVANHQSMLDILACLGGVPVPFKFLAKRELFKIPCVGWHMALSGYIPLDRSSRESGRQAILKAQHWLRRGVSVLFYPEGTRSLDGNIKAFKMGAFKIAAEQGLEILPVVVDGTGDAVPKKSWMLEKLSNFTISIGKPVAMNSKDPEKVMQIKEEIREEMIQRLAEMRK